MWLDIDGRYIAAMATFSNDTSATRAIYDTAGSLVKDAIDGNGYETCLCCALIQTGETRFKAAFCWWVDGFGGRRRLVSFLLEQDSSG
jgi:hypothetical protein